MEAKERARSEEDKKRLDEKWDNENGGPGIPVRKNFYIG